MLPRLALPLAALPGIGAGLALIFDKCRIIFRSPPMASEDVRTYLAAALEYPWLQALFKGHVGYLSLYNNLISVLTISKLPIHAWADAMWHANILAVLIAMLMPFLGRSALWPHRWQQALIPSLIAVAGLLREQENLWLSLSYAQFFFPLATMFILFSQPLAPWVVPVRLLVICISMTTGITSAMLAPAFILKALWLWRQKSPQQRLASLEAGLALACCALQLSYVIEQAINNDPSDRFRGYSVSSFAGYIANTIFFLPFLDKSLLNQIADGPITLRLQLLGALIYALWAWRRFSAYELCWLALTLGMCLTFYITAIGAREVMAQPLNQQFRYSYTPGALALILVVLHLTRELARRRSLWLNAPLALLVTTAQLNNHNHYPYPANFFPWQPQTRAHDARQPGVFIINAIGGRYYYCPAYLCNAARRHERTEEIRHPMVSMKKSSVWRMEDQGAVAHGISGGSFVLPTIPSSTERHSVVRLIADGPDGSTATLSCNLAGGYLSTAGKVEKQAPILTLVLPKMRGQARCHAKLEGEKGTYGLRLITYH